MSVVISFWQEFLLPKSTADCMNYLDRLSVTVSFLAYKSFPKKILKKCFICSVILKSFQIWKENLRISNIFEVFFIYSLFRCRCFLSLINWLSFCIWTACSCFSRKSPNSAPTTIRSIEKTFYFFQFGTLILNQNIKAPETGFAF